MTYYPTTTHPLPKPDSWKDAWEVTYSIHWANYIDVDEPYYVVDAPVLRYRDKGYRYYVHLYPEQEWGLGAYGKLPDAPPTYGAAILAAIRESLEVVRDREAEATVRRAWWEARLAELRDAERKAQGALEEAREALERHGETYR